MKTTLGFRRKSTIYSLPRRGFNQGAFLSLLLRIPKIRYDPIVDPGSGSHFSRAGRNFPTAATKPALTVALTDRNDGPVPPAGR